ncbi:hypothetical protein [Cellulomonas chengniuliangii]|uniref:Uncharacterized protein n=1 Tax=Cellulomonas chengniuliangii TaxID=2968084 RepID=A0ABY5L0F4_9CELL|nr:hypothetical protein [Cellulomonas chengniuliangii]MCC2309270.1 hypothetical protein [Cellulomonas chengniuliangii]MCC2318614.1 hypothetical protein [Cellulomonas chengniuliangii]UUI75161.1 hypothetical protein NP064_15530 [Cellulomonas chengniuliangii]
MRLTVDGEVFDVQERSDEPGAYDLIWEHAGGPRPGFSIARNDRAKLDEAVLIRAIRNFLGRVDPETGRID